MRVYTLIETHAFTPFGHGAMQKKTDKTAEFNPMGCNCLALRQAARQVTQLYERHMAPVGLRATQYSILARLARRGPLSINELAEAMLMDRTTTSRNIRPLQRDKLISIGFGPGGRKRVIALTPAGAARVKAAS